MKDFFKFKFNFNVKLSICLFIIYVATFIIDLFTFKSIEISAVILCVGALFLYVALLSRIDKKYYIGIAIFTFFAQYLGGMLNMYDIIPIYDNLLHLASGTLLVLLFDYVYTLLVKSDKSHKDYKIPKSIRIGFSFLGSMASAAGWEIWEYTGDKLFALSSQGGLDDTMTDIIAGTIGAIIGIFMMIAILKNKKEAK